MAIKVGGSCANPKLLPTTLDEVDLLVAINLEVHLEDLRLTQAQIFMEIEGQDDLL